MSKVFVSYARDESKKVYRILSKLKTHGIDFWVDTLNIENGKDWAEEISKAIKRCSKFLLFMSQASMNSDNTRREVEIAYKNSKKIVVLRLDDSMVPSAFMYALAGIQWTDHLSTQWEAHIAIALRGERNFIRKSNTYEIKRQSINNSKSRLQIEMYEPKQSNQFRYLLQKAIDLYSSTQKRSFADILNEMNDQLGYGRESQTIQNWLQNNTIPNSAEVEYFAKKISSGTNLDSTWIKEFFDAAGYEVPNNLIISKMNATDNSSGVVETAINSNIIMNYINPSEQPADIFVSYARTDIKIVESIYRSLKNKKHKPWMDVYSIKGGENWFRAISKAIDECEIFLAVLSNNSVSRRGVIQKELKKAMDKWEGMLPDDIYILPLRIDDCPIPELLNDLHVIDWDNGKGRKKLLDAIGVGLARRKARG